jgi:hypothetical protein
MDANEMSSKFKKKNGRLVQDHIQGGQMGHSLGGGSKGMQQQMGHTSNHNRKLTPSKVNIGIRGSN